MESLRRGVSGMDAAKAVKGHGWPLRGDPRSSDGMRGVERSETRMQGQAFLVTFSAFGKSDSPSRAKPEVRATLSVLSAKSGCASNAGSRASSLLRMATGQCVTQLVGDPLVTGLADEGGRINSPLQGRRPPGMVMCTTTPSAPADSSPESAAPLHSPAPYSGRSDSAATRTAPTRHGWRYAVHRPACRNRFR